MLLDTRQPAAARRAAAATEGHAAARAKPVPERDHARSPRPYAHSWGLLAGTRRDLHAQDRHISRIPWRAPRPTETRPPDPHPPTPTRPS